VCEARVRPKQRHKQPRAPAHIAHKPHAHRLTDLRGSRRRNRLLNGFYRSPVLSLIAPPASLLPHPALHLPSENKNGKIKKIVLVLVSLPKLHLQSLPPCNHCHLAIRGNGNSRTARWLGRGAAHKPRTPGRIGRARGCEQLPCGTAGRHGRPAAQALVRLLARDPPASAQGLVRPRRRAPSAAGRQDGRRAHPVHPGTPGSGPGGVGPVSERLVVLGAGEEQAGLSAAR